MTVHTQKVRGKESVPRVGIPIANPRRLLATPLTHKLLGAEVTADLYACNGFRFIATPACIHISCFNPGF